MPGIISDQYPDRNIYYSSYISTFIERDVQNLTEMLDVLKFNRFVIADAARTSQLLNYKALAEDQNTKALFYDTGLVCYLTKWSSSEVLESDAMSGALLENFAVSKIVKSYQNAGQEPYIYFYRNHDAKEIDVILEVNRELCPLEIKKTVLPDSRIVKTFGAIDKAPLKRGTGAVLCMAERVLRVRQGEPDHADMGDLSLGASLLCMRHHMFSR